MVAQVDVSMYELYCDTLVDLLTAGKRKDAGGGGAMGPGAKAAPALSIKLAQHTSSGLVEVLTLSLLPPL